jgi:hypothetical protein
MQISAYEFLLMEMAEYFKRVACYVKEHDDFILLKFQFIGINKLQLRGRKLVSRSIRSHKIIQDEESACFILYNSDRTQYFF